MISGIHTLAFPHSLTIARLHVRRAVLAQLALIAMRAIHGWLARISLTRVGAPSPLSCLVALDLVATHDAMLAMIATLVASATVAIRAMCAA